MIVAEIAIHRCRLYAIDEYSLREYNKEMLTRSDLKLIKELLNEQQKIIEEKMIRFKDEILHEIVDLRDDVAVITGYRDMIEDHEIRLTSVEKVLKKEPAN